MPYRTPAPEIVEILDAPPTPHVSLSPDRKFLLLTDYEPYPPIALLAKPFHKLAGLRLDPTRPGTQKTTRFTRLTLLATEDGATREVTGLPESPSVEPHGFSHDGSRFALTLDLPGGGLEFWIGDVESSKAHCPNPALRLSDTIGAPVRWLDDDRLLVTLAAPGWESLPAPPSVPEGPIETEASGKKSRMATYQDLLASPHDEALFAHLTTVQLAIVNATTGETTLLGAPTLLAAAQPSPSGEFLLVVRLTPPFSYRVPYHLFARSVEIWSLETGEILHAVARLPIADEVPQQGVPTGPRSFQWHQTRPSTLLWAEALDGGDPLAKVEHRDQLMHAEITPQPPVMRELLRTTHRFAGIDWLEREDEFLLTEYDRDRRWRTTHRANFARPELGNIVFDLSVNDAYGDPGHPVHVPQGDGRRLVRCDGDAIFLSGRGASPSGDRPFLDRFDLVTKEKMRLFECSDEGFQSFVAFGPNDALITSHQSRTQPANFYISPLSPAKQVLAREGMGVRGERALTNFADPHPQVTGLHKELVRYARADGVPLSGTLYLPPSFDPASGEKLPLLFWAYPEEYNDAATAGQVRGSEQTFTRLAGTSPLWFVLNGWAVLMDAAVPVVGDPETANDTFAEQIVGAAQAAIDYLAVERGLVDATRVVCGGHSYGAFMTANLLARAPGLFAAGIARSGAYNRTLTPFGFQSERRSYWEAPEIYRALSPFTFADKIVDPILLIHGQADNNPGTHTMQSERFYQALQAFGAPSRLVLLPHESHGYRARESVLHVLWEMLNWAERHTRT